MLKMAVVLSFLKVLFFASAHRIYFPYNQENIINSTCTMYNNGMEGKCRRFRDCSLAIQNLPDFQPEHCYYDKHDPIVCCPESDRYPQIHIRASEDTNIRKINKLCYSHYSTTKGPKGHQCSFGACEILNCWSPSYGEIAPIMDHMYITSLGWLTGTGTYDFRCGGFLVSRFFVITAAHCVRTNPNIVRLGDKVFSKFSQDVGIERVYIHPDYNSPQVYNDIAIIKLASEANEIFDLACLWTDEDDTKIPNLTAIGFGATQFAGTSSDELYRVRLKVMGNELCDKLYPRDYHSPNGTVATQICIGDPSGKMDTCNGDSGGPVFTQLQLALEPECKIQLEAAYVVGITSFGGACGFSNGAVYTRISQYLDWIESIVFADN